MKQPSSLSVLTVISLSSQVFACMEFTGVFPFSHTSPFEASIIDNGVTTCWISTSLAEHTTAQEELFSHQQNRKTKKRSVGTRIALTDQPAYNPTTSPPALKTLPNSSSQRINEQHINFAAVPPPRSGELPKTEKMEELEWDDIPVWQPWQFECISGYKARANVGMRVFTYVAHGQEFNFVPKLQEDIWNEKWLYSKQLWCGEKDKKGNVVARPKPGEAKKQEAPKVPGINEQEKPRSVDTAGSGSESKGVGEEKKIIGGTAA